MGKCYAVARGARVGIFSTWNEASQYVTGYPGAVHKSFPSREQADRWLETFLETQLGSGAQLGTAQPPNLAATSCGSPLPTVERISHSERPITANEPLLADMRTLRFLQLQQQHQLQQLTQLGSGAQLGTAQPPTLAATSYASPLPIVERISHSERPMTACEPLLADMCTPHLLQLQQQQLLQQLTQLGSGAQLGTAQPPNLAATSYASPLPTVERISHSERPITANEPLLADMRTLRLLQLQQQQCTSSGALGQTRSGARAAAIDDDTFRRMSRGEETPDHLKKAGNVAITQDAKPVELSRGACVRVDDVCPVNSDADATTGTRTAPATLDSGADATKRISAAPAMSQCRDPLTMDGRRIRVTWPMVDAAPSEFSGVVRWLPQRATDGRKRTYEILFDDGDRRLTRLLGREYALEHRAAKHLFPRKRKKSHPAMHTQLEDFVTSFEPDDKRSAKSGLGGSFYGAARSVDEDRMGAHSPKHTGIPHKGSSPSKETPHQLKLKQWLEQLKAPSVKCVVLVDLDNWPSFFKKLTFEIPESISFGAFARHDLKSLMLKNVGKSVLSLVEKHRLLCIPANVGKDAADVRMIMTAQKVALLAPPAVTILLLSGDGIFKNAQAVLQDEGRQVFCACTNQHSENFGCIPYDHASAISKGLHGATGSNF
eukprot:gene3662-4597_t